MLKKFTYGAAGVLLVGALLYGGNTLGYVQTAFQSVRNRANDAVPISFQLDAAKGQLAKIDPEIKDMVWQIAKEKAQVKKLATQIAQQDVELEKQYNEMMALKQHVTSGEKFYVATNGKAYTNDRVKDDLSHRFKMYQTAEKTSAKSKEILRLRTSSLDSALAKLEEAKSQKRELEIQVENLAARQKMNEVVITASQINIDNSQLSKARQMLEDIDARLSAEEEMLNLIPKYTGQIPVSENSTENVVDVIEAMDAYFDKAKDSDSQDHEETSSDELVDN
jgi:chromosome segregation ATPase